MSYDFQKLYEQFIRHRRYVDNYSHNTIRCYEWAWKEWKRVLGTSEISKALCVEYVAKMREKGTSPATCNVNIKSMNGFLIWLFENDYIPERWHIKHLKAPQKVIEPVSDEAVRRIINWKPKSWWDNRLYAILCTLADTGCRVDELLSLERASVDFDNLLLKVRGKGNKERLVPFSLECRKVLFKFLQRHNFDLVFPAHNGAKWRYGNMWRDLQSLLKKLGCERVGCHAFATQYLKHGGNVFYLQRQLGHKNLATTRRYVKIDDEDLQREQARLSPLSRLR